MTRLDELDRVPFERGQRAAVRRIAEWALSFDHRNQTRVQVMRFLRETFGFTAKKCIGPCKQWKDDFDFPKSTRCSDGRLNWCRACDSERKREWKRKSAERYRALHREAARRHREKGRKAA